MTRVEALDIAYELINENDFNDFDCNDKYEVLGHLRDLFLIFYKLTGETRDNFYLATPD